MTTPPIDRPNPSDHWTDAQRRTVLIQVAAHPNEDGVFHSRHMPKSVKRAGMALHQFEVEGLLEFVPADNRSGMAWRLTDAGREFMVG